MSDSRPMGGYYGRGQPTHFQEGTHCADHPRNDQAPAHSGLRDSIPLLRNRKASRTVRSICRPVRAQP
eukprot:1385139-Prorocentrum_lima.AAC.1